MLPWALAVSLPLLAGAFLIALIRRLRARLAERVEARRRGCLDAGERILIEPERASFRGAERDYGRVKCDGAMFLSEKRLVFIPMLGKPVELPAESVAEVGETRWFLSSGRIPGMHLVLHLADGNRVGFFTRDNAGWIESLVETGARQLDPS